MATKKKADDDSSVDAAAERDIDKVKRRVAEATESAADEGPKIRVAPDDDDDDGDDDAPSVSTEPASRQEKKRNRYREAREAAEAARRETAELRGQLQQMATILQERSRQAEPKAEQKDPYQEKLDSIAREQRLLYSEINARGNTLSQADLDKYEQRANELRRQEIDIAAERKFAQLRQQTPQPDQHANAVQAMLQLQNSDVYGNAEAVNLARAYFDLQVKRGRTGDYELHQEAMDFTRKQLGMTPRNGSSRAPSQADRAKYAGVPRGGGGSGGDSDTVETVTMGKDFRRIADAMYGHIKDEKKRYEMWAKGPGRRAIQKAREEGRGA